MGDSGVLEGLSYSALIGLVVVSGSSVSELRYPRVAPGVGFLASRMLLEGDEGPAALRAMELSSERAVMELASAGVDAIAYCCTVSGAQRGLAGDRGFCAAMERRWGIPVTSTMLAAAEALGHLGVGRAVLCSPYPHSYHAAEIGYLAEAGIATAGAFGMGLSRAAEFAAVTPGEIFRFSLEAWERAGADAEAEGLFVSCMNFDGMAAAQALEDAIGRPVVTSHSATLWRALGLAGVEGPVRGYGGLLAEAGRGAVVGVS